VVNELAIPRTSEQLPEGEDVRHPAGDPQLHGLVEPGQALVVEPGETAVGVACSPGEVE
jgi:hypothetical protein